MGLRRSLFAFLAVALVAPAAATAAPVTSLPADTAAATEYWTSERMAEAAERSLPRAGVAQAGPLPVPGPAHLLGMRAVGVLFSVRPDGEPRGCTATLVDSPNESVLWTAGHCVHTGRRGAFHTQLVFVPGYRAPRWGNQAPYGVWPIAQVAVTRQWARKGINSSGNLRAWRTAQHDAAAALIARNAAGATLRDAIGVAQHIRFKVRRARGVRMIGYPGAAPYLGNTLMQCGPGRTRTEPYAPNLFGIPCSLGPGMSGGPALVRLDPAGVGTVIGQMTLTDLRRMFVSYQGNAIRNLYRTMARKPL
jgi:V8-like Glu-specific endopeptidase